jgi:uncharacterized protein
MIPSRDAAVYKVYIAVADTGRPRHWMRTRIAVSRRRFLQGAACASAAALGLPRLALGTRDAGSLRPFPLSAIRLAPSPWLQAVESNRAYLARLEPDRLLHNFRAQAGLPPKAAPYGGWEAETIAGHTLGHYLSACALMHAQTGDTDCRARVDYMVAELAACQRAGRDGYVAGFTRKNAGTGALEPGRRVLEDISRGEIHAAPFYINGCWAPFYNWHKLFAGLLEADAQCGNREALGIATALAAYIERKLAPLDEARMQSVLSTEFGGISEALAELCARTGEPRWLALARRFHHRAVLDPLVAGRDELAYLHANTQIPKVIGLARRAELESDPSLRSGARYFWQAVTGRRSYVIGGNSDREYFQEPGSISRYITEQTCESCNTYNMLKLTRRLFAAEPRAAYFDYYERAHLNHILAQHRPADGMFAYMVPLMSGAAREWSEPFDSFWCCVGTGMESHAKHGDSVFWQDSETLSVNLFIPASLDWAERGARVALDTAYPFGERVALRIEAIQGREPFTVAMRLPAWCEAPSARLNGRDIPAVRDAGGYLRLRRRWKAGDVVELVLPQSLRLETTPDDSATVALLRGPLVLAADLGPASAQFDGPAPALVAADPLATISTVDQATARYGSGGSGRPADLAFAPFFSLSDRRTAVYFKRYTPPEWEDSLALRAAERARAAELDARSVDVIRLGVEDDERRHRLTSDISYAVSYRFRPGRDARTGGFFEFDAAVREEPLVLRATYWGGERDRQFHIEVDGRRIASERLAGEQAGEFIERDYGIPVDLLKGRERIRIRIQPEPGYTAGPLFGCRILAASSSG